MPQSIQWPSQGGYEPKGLHRGSSLIRIHLSEFFLKIFSTNSVEQFARAFGTIDARKACRLKFQSASTAESHHAVAIGGLGTSYPIAPTPRPKAPRRQRSPPAIKQNRNRRSRSPMLGQDSPPRSAPPRAREETEPIWLTRATLGQRFSIGSCRGLPDSSAPAPPDRKPPAEAPPSRARGNERQMGTRLPFR